MLFIGDVHGRYDRYVDIIEKHGDSTFQVGDMGVGFGGHNLDLDGTKHEIPYYRLKYVNHHRWIRGNHDNPEVCRTYGNYLGDYGYNEHLDMFWMSGGLSVDQQYRTVGISWWEDEELSYADMDKAIKLYGETQPSIVVTHECPTAVKSSVMTNGMKAIQSRTENALQAMLDIHAPDVWIFGHHHQRKTINIGATEFQCLHELISGPPKDCVFEIPNMEWERGSNNASGLD